MRKTELIKAMTDAPATVWGRLTKKVAWAYRRGEVSPPVFALYTSADTLPEREVWDDIRKQINNARRVKRYHARKVSAERAAVERRDYMRSYMRRYRSTSKQQETSDE
jgi:hypothetical protein